MILEKIKKILVVLMLITLVGCSEVDGSEKFSEVILAMDNISNYSITSVNKNYYDITSNGTSEKFDSTVTETFNTDGIKSYSIIETISSLGDDMVEENYFADGYYYISSEDEKYIVEGGNSNNQPLSIKASLLGEGVEKVTLKKFSDYDLITVVYTEEKQKEIYEPYAMAFGLNINDITYKPYVLKLKVNDKIIEEETIVEYSYKSEQNSLSIKSETITTFNQYGDVIVELPKDIDKYVYLNQSTENKESLKEKLVNVLQYTKEGNRYTLLYNENETYIFDFDNTIFTYMLSTVASSYNWTSFIGISDKCTYDFTNKKELGTCTNVDLENIKATKNYLEVELMQIDESMESLLGGK